MGLFSLGGNKMIQPQEELVDEEHPRRYKPFDYDEYLRFYRTKKALESECRIKAFCGINYDDEKWKLNETCMCWVFPVSTCITKLGMICHLIGSMYGYFEFINPDS